MAAGQKVSSDNIRYFGSRPRDAARHKNDAYRAYFARNPSGLYLVSKEDGIIKDCNQAFAHLLGYDSPQDLLGKELSTFFSDPALCRICLTRFDQETKITGDQQCLRRRDGTKIWIVQDIAKIDGPGEDDKKILGTVIDISSQKQKEEQFLQSALYDSLTGLPNRSLFLDRLSVCFDRARRDNEYQFAVLFLDLDRFKWINDSFGHRLGDELLIAAAKRLNSKIRGGDTVARLGGDEFALLLAQVKDSMEAPRVAARIQKAFKNPFRLGDRELYITVSIGIAMSSGQWLCDQDGTGEADRSPLSQPSGVSRLERPEDLLWEADAVLYRAKQMGRSRFEVFDATMHRKIVTLAKLERDLRTAVEKDQFTNHYSPVISLQSGRIIGFEGCIRWQHPERGLLVPADFEMIAEQMGLHGTIDRMFMKNACTHLKALQDKFPQMDHLFVSVDLSVSVFRDPGFVSFVADLLNGMQIGRNRLWLEITESALIENFESIRQSLDELRSVGVSIIMNDFGTGFSSLKGLPQFPVDVLKIDASLIAGMKVNDMYVEVVGTLVALGHSLGFSIFADGVEDPQQAKELRRLGCDGAQGSYISEPVDAVITHRLLQQNRIY